MTSLVSESELLRLLSHPTIRATIKRRARNRHCEVRHGLEVCRRDGVHHVDTTIRTRRRIFASRAHEDEPAEQSSTRKETFATEHSAAQRRTTCRLGPITNLTLPPRSLKQTATWRRWRQWISTTRSSAQFATHVTVQSQCIVIVDEMYQTLSTTIGKIKMKAALENQVDVMSP